MRTQGGPAFILARQADYRLCRDTSEVKPGKLVTLAPRWISDFRPWPWGGERNERLDFDSPLTEVTYRGNVIVLFLAFRDFLQALADAGARVVDMQPKPEAK